MALAPRDLSVLRPRRPFAYSLPRVGRRAAAAHPGSGAAVQDDVRASLEDLAIRWETPKGRELKARIVSDVKRNRGEGLSAILEGFLYVGEVPGGRDLRGITLEGEDLSEAIFGKCDLSWASFARSNLQRADLRSSMLKRADMTDANLTMARFDFADCSRADFSRSSLDGTHFKEARLTGAVFESADVSRASFESASLAKANFRAAKLEQTNFFNADCNNSNFDGAGLDRVAARPAKAWGLRFDMDRDEFEKQVGLKAITSRTTKRFKGLDALLKLASAGPVGEQKKGAGDDQDMRVFGAPLRGTQKLKPIEDDLHFGSGPRGAADDVEASQRPTTAFREEGEAEATPGGGVRRRPPPPPPPSRPALRKAPPMALGAPPPASGVAPAPAASPAAPPPAGPPTGRGGGRPGPAPASGPPTARGPRPGAPPSSAQPRPRPAPPPKLPVAPIDPDAPEPLSDWAKTIGQLMQLKPSITKILVEVEGEKSRIIYKVDPPKS